MNFKLISIIAPELAQSLSKWGEQWAALLAERIGTMKEAVGERALVVAATGEVLPLLGLSGTSTILLTATTGVSDVLSAVISSASNPEEVWIIWDLRYPDISISTLELLYRKARESNSSVVILREVPTHSHPAMPAGQMGLFKRIVSWFLNSKDRWSVETRTDHREGKEGPAAQVSKPSVWSDDSSGEIVLDMELNGVVPRPGCYALLVRAWSPEGQVLVDSCLYWWRHQDSTKKEEVIVLEPLTGLGLGEDHLNLRTYAEIRNSRLWVKWSSIAEISEYEVVLLDIMNDGEPPWCYPVVPDVICSYNPSQGGLIRRDTKQRINRRQDIPPLFESMGYMCAGKQSDLVKLWDGDDGLPVRHYVVPAHEAFLVDTPLSFARYMARLEKNHVPPRGASSKSHSIRSHVS